MKREFKANIERVLKNNINNLQSGSYVLEQDSRGLKTNETLESTIEDNRLEAVIEQPEKQATYDSNDRTNANKVLKRDLPDNIHHKKHADR